MSPRSRRHGVPPPAFLGVLVAMLLALGLAGTASAGSLLAAQDVVVNVTAGANDPVSGATVVARDDLTGRVMSNATTTGYLGYAAIRLRPGASTRRITITATGGRSKAVGTLSAADVMSATAQRAVMASEIEVNVNPGSTVLAEYLDERPRASVAAAERAVARRLRLPTGTDVAESARFSRLRFSGEDFIGAARTRGGVEDYAEWAASRIASGTALPGFAAQVPADDLPYRGSAGQRRNEIDGLLLAPFKPLLGALGTKVLCAMALPQKLAVGASLCEDKEAARQLSPEDKQQLDAIEQGISNLRVQMSGVEATLGNLDVQVGNLGGQVATLKYQAEMNAVDDVVKAAAVVAGVRAQGGTAPDHNMRTLQNALVQRLAINAGCPDWAALVGSLPPAVMRDAQGPRHPDAACAPSSLGVGTQNGLLQFAQRTTAAASRFVAAGPTQATVDAAGEFWLGEFARNVFSMNISLAYALQAGTSTRSSTAVDATAELFEDVVDVINLDATGTYFGARIPNDRVLAMGATQGTIYGIGSYQDPGSCRGGALWPVQYRFAKIRLPDTHVVHRMSYLPGGAEPLDRTRRACRAAEFIVPPPAVPGAGSTLEWQPAKEIRADHGRNGIRGLLRSAALCRVQEAVVAASTSRPISPLSFDGGGGTICVPGRTAIPERLGVEWSNSGKKAGGALPNLQLSLDHGACAPWEVGTAMSRFLPVEALIRGSGYGTPQDLVTAVGMQCPVTDLTPRADKATGWNCVSANPSGRVASASFSIINGVSRPGNFDARPVTSSLGGVLDVRSMGGYCPIGRLYDRLDPFRWYCSPGLRPPIENERLDCTSGGLQATIGKLTSYFEPGSTAGQTSRTYRPVVPSGARLNELTAVGINVGAQNWTSNNDVAGDFVVGPLYTSDAVGAYVPGTSPGAPAATAPPRVKGVAVPDAVRDLSLCGSECTGDTTSIRVAWRAPASSGGMRILSYEVVAKTRGSGPAGPTAQTRPCPATKPLAMQCVIRGLNLAQDWDVTVRARNALGKGAASIMTFTAGPDRPTLRPMFQALEVRWGPPKSWDLVSGAGGLQGALVSQSYRATALPGGRTCTADGFSSTRCIITGLTPGTAYTVKVVLVGKYYRGSMMTRDDAASLPSAPAIPLSTASRPDAPEIDSAVPSAGRINVTWREPKSDGASPIAGYTVMADPGGATCITTGALSCSIDGLAPAAEYAVTVTAANGVGVGPRSSPLRRRTPPALPGPPLTPLAKASPGTIEVSWVAPDFNGGAAVTGYTATASPGGAQCTTDGATTCTITGLPDGTEHQVTVTATNAVGTGPASLPAAARTPSLTAPGAPRSVELTALPGRIEVAWSAPESDGGSLVTGYIATATPGGATCTTTGATLCTITGLDDGTAYRVAVAAINVVGTGAPSDAGEAVTPRRDEGGAAPVVDDLPLQATSIPGTAESGLPVGAPVAGRTPEITGLALRPRTLVPGLGGRIAYSLSEPADVTITIARVGGRDRASRVVHRIPAGRPGALAGDTRIRVLYSFASARRKKPGAWTLTVEARDAQGGVATETIPIRVRT